MRFSNGGGGDFILLNDDNHFTQEFKGHMIIGGEKLEPLFGKSKTLSVAGQSHSSVSHRTVWELRDKNCFLIEQFLHSGGSGVAINVPLVSNFLTSPGIIVEDLEIWQKSIAHSSYMASNTLTLRSVLL